MNFYTTIYLIRMTSNKLIKIQLIHMMLKTSFKSIFHNQFINTTYNLSEPFAFRSFNHQLHDSYGKFTCIQLFIHECIDVYVFIRD